MSVEAIGKPARELPAIILYGDIFIPLGCLISRTFTAPKDLRLIRSLAKDELKPQNDKDMFRGNVVLIPGKIKSEAIKLEKCTQSEAYLGVAVLASIEECRTVPDSDRLDVRFLTIGKVEVVRFSSRTIYTASVKDIKEYDEDSFQAKRLRKSVSGVLDKLVEYQLVDSDSWNESIKSIQEMTTFTDLLIANANSFLKEGSKGAFSDDDFELLFEELDVSERLRFLYEKLRSAKEEMDVAIAAQAVQDKIDKKVASHMKRLQNEHILREKKEKIIKELSELDPQDAEKENSDDEFAKRIEEAGMPDDVKKVAKSQLEKLRVMRGDSAETNVVRNYLDWLCSLPWDVRTKDIISPADIQRTLDEDHYDLERVKKRIVEYMAVRKLNPKAKFPILTLIGPPGVGKTSLANSLARATGRKLYRKSLGGLRDEAEIRGHRRTYVGALPGFVISGLRKVGVKNPIFVLDEIDKLEAGKFHGDPAAALLEVLDPEVNSEFSDHYLEVGFDLSEIMFVCTGNVLGGVPPTLRDRMYIIELEGYTPDQKYHIAKRHLIGKQIKEHGLDGVGAEVGFTDAAIYGLIDGYARESGVRELERKIASVCRGLAVRFAEGMLTKSRVSVDNPDLDSYLGPAEYDGSDRITIDEPGIGIGLAYTMYGGTTMKICSCKMRGTGNLVVTGRAAEVMQESAQVAFSCAKHYLESHIELLPQGFTLDDLQKLDIHIQFERNKIPKDGPSAGAMMALIFISLITGRKIRSDLAGTGEINLREGGKVTAVGGIKHKLIAANREGLLTVFIPSLNCKDLIELPQQVKDELKIVPVNTIQDVVSLALL
jgi:ATP-dependent Lon protease